MLSGGDEAGAEIGQVGAEHLFGENLVAVVDAAGQQQSLVEELADFRDQRESPGPGVAARAGRHRIGPSTPASRPFGVAAGGDVVEYQAAVAMHSVYRFAHCAEAGMTIGTRCSTQIRRSACNRGLVLWTIRFTA